MAAAAKIAAAELQRKKSKEQERKEAQVREAHAVPFSPGADAYTDEAEEVDENLEWD